MSLTVEFTGTTEAKIRAEMIRRGVSDPAEMCADLLYQAIPGEDLRVNLCAAIRLMMTSEDAQALPRDEQWGLVGIATFTGRFVDPSVKLPVAPAPSNEAPPLDPPDPIAGSLLWDPLNPFAGSLP